MAQTRLETELRAHLEKNAGKAKRKASVHVDQNIYNRLFDGVTNLLEETKSAELMPQLQALIEYIYHDAEKTIPHFKILLKTPVDPTKSNVMLDEKMGNVVRNSKITTFIQGIANQIIDLAYSEIIDEKNDTVRPYLVNLFNLGEFKSHPQVSRFMSEMISGFCIEVIGQLFLKLNDVYKDAAKTIGFQAVSRALEQQFQLVIQQSATIEEIKKRMKADSPSASSKGSKVATLFNSSANQSSTAAKVDTPLGTFTTTATKKQSGSVG